MKRINSYATQPHQKLSVPTGLLFAIWIVQNLFAVAAHGHGYMTYPNSRSMDHIAGDKKGWPIAGIKANLRREPCLGLKVNKKFTEVKPGPMQLEFLFGDGANHIGPCYAFLIDPLDPGNKTKIGEMMHCARSVHPGAGSKGQDIPGRMTVTIPEKLPCDPSHCVLQWVWVGTHVSVTNPEKYEYYDNCADLKIVGVQEAAVKAKPMPPASSDAASDPSIAIGRANVQHMISYALSDGGISNKDAILSMKRSIEALKLERPSSSSAQRQAGTDNQRGIEYLRNGQVAEAVQRFQAAYQAVPTDPEIINNLGYAHLLHNDPQAAEPLLLLALVFEPGRANAWANLGQSYAIQGKHDEAVACFSLAYRFSRNQDVTRKFLETLTKDENSKVRVAAERTLQLQFVLAGAD